ncbi:hypothetical protein BDA99DRAFT_511054 [Phascolomyces articulosus]|uniref:F-box domain-containing protein n=1 Tax=Phascolomyces articulosus TaxID=60185 RepID=A0AAD5K9H3_9FUNG|nr:hypothetical protein BDA99DRAFT_511054 [Phascolomyces articulosus]
MEHSILNQLTMPIHMAEHSLRDGHLATAIKCSTVALENLHEIQCELLSIRVAAYQRQGNFSKAHDDAVILQKEMPNDFRGYVYAAESLLKQEKMIEAIDTCEAILPRRRTKFYARIPQHQALWRLRKTAIYNQRHRMDPIKKLPYDVITVILDQLILSDILCCMNVSKTWCYCILACCVKNLNSLEFSDKDDGNKVMDYFYDKPTEFYRAIQLLSDQVKELKIHCYSNPKIKEVSSLLGNLPFRHLQSLSVDDCDDVDPILPTLLNNSKYTLKNLYLGNTCKVNVNEILDLCPNIAMLQCSAPIYPLEYNNTKHQQIQLLHPHSNLTHLHITTKGIQIKNLKQILKYASNLHKLTLAEENPNILRVFHRQYNNHLRHICLHPEGTSPHNNSDSEYIDTTRFNGTIDIYHCYNVNSGLLLPIMNNQRRTEALSLTVSPECHLEDWAGFSTFASPYLRYIKLSFTQETEDVFANIVSHCPSLEEILIHNLSHPPRLFLYSVKYSLPNLRCFGIENSPDHARGNPNIAVGDHALREFFAHYASLEEKNTSSLCSLEEIRLRNVSNVETATLLQLVKIHSLKAIHIVGLDHDFVRPSKAPVMRELARKAKGLYSFNCLVLDGHDITDQDMEGLDCTVLRLERMPLITKEGMKDLLERSKKLKTLTIFECEKLDRDVMMDLVADIKRIQLVYEISY